MKFFKNIRYSSFLVLTLLFSLVATAQDVDSYRVDEAQRKEAHDIFYSQDPEDIRFPTDHPGAQWFPLAGLGLFMHWGIYSVDGIDPSWAMIKNCSWHVPRDKYSYYQDKGRQHYYALAEKFNPVNYDPDQWMAAAKAAGFSYAVLTTKHHDGYALWPTKYGDMNTRVFLGGRDLLNDYVDACRRHGLKVGFYFSPRDWHYPGFPAPAGFYDIDPDEVKEKIYIHDNAENQRKFEEFYAYTIGQLRELLTRYGKIDLLWFDGVDWKGIDDTRAAQTLDWIRELQPGIVINPRWDGVGDFRTTECRPGVLPEGYHAGQWWEACNIWSNGSWGYDKTEKFKPLSWVFENLVYSRQFGGNFLCNVGPRPDGLMAQQFYVECKLLEAWMQHSKASLIGAGPTPGIEKSNVPITTGQDVWYLHLLPDFKGTPTLNVSKRPKKVYGMRTGESLTFSRDGDRWNILFPEKQRTTTDDVIVVAW
jgi:alpha-L-fucosidase